MDIPCPGALFEITGGGPIQGPVFGPEAYIWLDDTDSAATPVNAPGFKGFPAKANVDGASPCTGGPDPKVIPASLVVLVFNVELICGIFEAGRGTLGGGAEGPFKGNKGCEGGAAAETEGTGGIGKSGCEGGWGGGGGIAGGALTP